VTGNHPTACGTLMFVFSANKLTQITISFYIYTELFPACPGHVRTELLISRIQKDHIIALEQYLHMPTATHNVDAT
jgi:hypothetical protein